MSTSPLDLRSHRPAIARDQVEALRRRLFEAAEDPPRIPGYEIEAKLGEGTFGVVYRAFHPGFQRRVALKVIEYHSARSLLRIDREAQALARLSHPNVVQVYDKGPAGDDRYYLALEFVEGVALDVWLGQQPRALPEVLDKFLQIAEGLAAAHAAGLVHRDLKPANAMVGDDGRVRVLDFGLARAPDSGVGTRSSHLVEPPTRGSIDARGTASCSDAESFEPTPRPTVAHVVPGQPPVSRHDGQRCSRGGELDLRLTDDGHFIGTPFYAAPEQHLGRADERSDQFSFCVALFEAIYGQKPYRLRAGGSLLDQLHAQPIQLPRGRQRAPRWLANLLRRGLHLDPEARHPSMRAIAEELRYRLHARPGHTRTLGLVATAVAMTAAAASTVIAVTPDEVAECTEQRHGVAPASWQSHRDAIRDRAPAIADELDAFAAQWSEEREGACYVAEPSRRARIDACLEPSRVALEHLVGWLSTAPDPTWAALASHPGLRPLAGLVDTMPSPRRCATGPVDDPGAAALPAWQHLLDGRMMQVGDDLEGAAVRTELAAAEARIVGARSLRLAAEYQARTIELQQGRTEDLTATLDLVVEALSAGERQLAAEISAHALTGHALGQHVLAIDRRPPRLEGLDHQVERGGEVLGATLLELDGPRLVLGGQPQRAGEHVLARAAFHEAAALLSTVEVPAHLVALISFQEAIMMSAGPEASQAAALAEQALAQQVEALGPDHPMVARSHRHLGELLTRLGREEDALSHYSVALERFAALGLDLDRALVHGEVAHVHTRRARRAALRAKQASERGEDASGLEAEMRHHRDLALVSIQRAEERLESQPAPADEQPPRRARERARLDAVAMRAYAFDPGCWDELMEVSERLDRACRWLDGDDPSCAAGRDQWRTMLVRGAAARASTQPCGPEPAPAK